MGRAKKYKSARRLAGQVAAEQPPFQPAPPRWWERLPLFGRWARARRERRNVLGLQLYQRAVKYATKKVTRRIIK